MGLFKLLARKLQTQPIPDPRPRHFPGLPRSLFRYRAIDDYLSGILNDDTLWFSPLAKLNDPCEAFYNLKLNWSDDYARIFLRFVRAGKINPEVLDDIRKAGNITEEELSSLPAMIAQMDEDIAIARLKAGYLAMDHSLFDSLRISNKFLDINTIYLCCFSANGSSPYMSYVYANKHRGVCLEFDTSYQPVIDARPVHYQDEVPVLDIGSDPYSMQVARMQTKSLEWGQEKEWRLFAHPREGVTRSFDPRALKSVTLGHETSDDDYRAVATMLNKKLHNETVRMFRFQPDSGSYSLIRRSLDT